MKTAHTGTASSSRQGEKSAVTCAAKSGQNTSPQQRLSAYRKRVKFNFLNAAKHGDE